MNIKLSFVSTYTIQNDLLDFKMPYRIHGKIDEEIMIDKYQRLKNQSRGLHCRLGTNSSG